MTVQRYLTSDERDLVLDALHQHDMQLRRIIESSRDAVMVARADKQLVALRALWREIADADILIEVPE